MPKKYKITEPEPCVVNEPAVSYGTPAEVIVPLTEEELKECITGDELREYMHKHIDKLFDR